MEGFQAATKMTTVDVDKKKRGLPLKANPLILLVGAAGFEPATSCSQSRRATRLRYAPTKYDK